MPANTSVVFMGTAFKRAVEMKTDEERAKNELVQTVATWHIEDIHAVQVEIVRRTALFTVWHTQGTREWTSTARAAAIRSVCRDVSCGWYPA